jgi:hypothetical protein
MVHCERSHGCPSGESPRGRHGDDPMRSIGRPMPLPPQATAMAGGERARRRPPRGPVSQARVIPSAARVTCGRMTRLTHEPTGSLDVDEGIRLGVRVTPAFETPSGLWAVSRPHAIRAHRWRHVAQPLRRPVQVAAPCAAQLRHIRLFPIDHHRYHRIMSRKILAVICASLSHISYVCRIIIHGVIVCYRLRGRVPVGCGKFHIPSLLVVTP